MQKAVWSNPYVSVAFFPSLKQNFIAYRSSKESSRPDCIFEIHQLWRSGFSKVYSNFYCNCSFEPEIIKIGQSSHKMYSYNILNFQESKTILNACTKKSGNLLNSPHIISIYLSIYLSLFSFFPFSDFVMNFHDTLSICLSITDYFLVSFLISSSISTFHLSLSLSLNIFFFSSICSWIFEKYSQVFHEFNHCHGRYDVRKMSILVYHFIVLFHLEWHILTFFLTQFSSTFSLLLSGTPN